MKNFLSLNLAALKQKNVKLANKLVRLNRASDEVIPVAVKGSSNKYTFKIKNNEGVPVLVHSIYNPVRQAKKEISKLNFDVLGLYGVLGFGGGYYIREILKQIHPKSIMIVIENRLDILRKVMELMDLTDIFNHPGFIIIDGTEEDLQSILNSLSLSLPVSAKLTDDIQFFVTPVLKEIERDEYNRLSKLFFNSLKFSSRIIGNAPQDTLVGLKQIFANLDYLIKSPDITRLNNKYRGKPAICVAAGPSLNKNINVLKKLQNKALIISADTILERLLREGIIPDIVGVLERGKIVYDSFFKDKVIDERVTLIGQSVIYPDIFTKFPGKRVVALKKGVNIEEWVSTLVPELLSIESGNSVANMNFSIARYFGCDPIILVGQDLAYGEDGVSHAKGTIYDNEDNEPKENKAQNDENEYILGKNGQQLRTRKWWKIFHYWFEMEIAKTDAKVIDATEGGALIKGTEVMTLKEAGDIYCREELNYYFSELLSEVDNTLIVERIMSLRNGIEAELAKLDDTEQIIGQALEILEKMHKYFEEKRFLDKIIAEYVGQINQKIAEVTIQNKIFMFIVQSLIVDTGRKDSKMGSIDTPEECEKWLKNKITLFIELKGISRITREIFTEGLDKIRAAEQEDSYGVAVE